MSKKNSIIINFLKGQGLGNQLWVYYAGIFLANYFQCNYKFGNGKIFKGFFLIEDNNILWEEINVSKKLRIKEKFEYFTDLDVTDYSSCMHDLGNLIQLSDVEIIGTLQSTKLIPNNKIIKKTLKINFLKQENICSIHIRGGDFKNTIVKPSKNYYLNALKLFEKNKFKIITDDPKYARMILPGIEIVEKIKSNFDELTNPHHFSEGIKDDFFLIAKSKANIISSSTFSFWASYIGAIFIKKKIVAPAYWFANRVSSSWGSPNEYIIKDWNYLDSNGLQEKNKISSFPKCIKFKRHNKYINFLIRKFLNKFILLN